MSTPVTCFDSVVKICECKFPPPKFNLSLPPLPGTTLALSSSKNINWLYGLFVGVLLLAFLIILIVRGLKWRSKRSEKYSFSKTSSSGASIPMTGNGEKTSCAVDI